MRIFVCVKQAANVNGPVVLSPSGALDRSLMEPSDNPCDGNAMELALQFKDETACRVTAVSMGPASAAGMLRDYLAMGANDAILISDPALAGSDSYATAQILAAAISRAGFGAGDLILCGAQSADGATAQVGPQVAELLHIPNISFAKAAWLGDGCVTAEQLLDGQYVRINCISVPCVITCTKDMNRPRRATVKGIFECSSRPLEQLCLADLIGATDFRVSPKIKTLCHFHPSRKNVGCIVEGTDEEIVQTIIRNLQTLGVLS